MLEELDQHADANHRHSSRQRYGAYRRTAAKLDKAARDKQMDDEELAKVAKDIRKKGGRRGVIVGRRRTTARNRTFLQLFKAFWAMLRGQRGRLSMALAILTVTSLLGLTMPYASKIVIDHVILDLEVPAWLSSLGMPQEK
ncbi:MAG: hypothetical protein AAGK78_13000, partial [Planctomycetota bacterium]